MLVAFLRTLILYLVVIFGMRLMGKRQLGELQPSELVITVLISNIATLPIENIDTPFFLGLLPILSLVAFEVIISAVNLKCRITRRIFSGRPVIVIDGGRVDQQALRSLRFSPDDLMAQLRTNGIFSVSEVDHAVVETTGVLTVYQKFADRPLTPSAIGMPDEPQKDSPQFLLVSGGTILEENLSASGLGEEWIRQTAASRKVDVEEIYILTADRSGSYDLIRKEPRK